jgi:hypothetical protein
VSILCGQRILFLHFIYFAFLPPNTILLLPEVPQIMLQVGYVKSTAVMWLECFSHKVQKAEYGTTSINQ